MEHLSNIYGVRQGPHSEHFIVLITYELAQQARVLHYNGLERLAEDKHSSLMGPFVSYEEMKSCEEVPGAYSKKYKASLIFKSKGGD